MSRSPCLIRDCLSSLAKVEFIDCKMFYVSEIKRTAPETFSTPLQKKVYETLAGLGIPFERVDTDPGITMEDCRNINVGLGDRKIIPASLPGTAS